MRVQEVWAELEAAPGPGIVARRVRANAGWDLRIAVEKPQNRRMVLLRAQSAAIRTMADFPSSEGFTVRRAMTSDPEPELVIQVALSATRYAEVFTSLVQDVVDHIAEITDEDEAVSALVARMRVWQEFLRLHGTEGLNDEAQRGLFGELWLIREHLIGAMGVRRAIAAWTGASRTSQDFQLPRAAIEVKTTAAKQHQKLAIVSERQLDDAGLEVLLLYHLSLDIRQRAGGSLVALVSEMRALVAQDPVAGEALDSKLLAYGYVDAHTSRYEVTGYIVRQANFFRVKSGFPRIVEKDLRCGVGDVTYTIQVSECMHHAVPASDAIALASRLP